MTFRTRLRRHDCRQPRWHRRARADCESDMNQLEAALKTPNLSADAKAALDDARVKSVAAMKKDDDATCHKAIAEALPKAGLKLK